MVIMLAVAFVLLVLALALALRALMNETRAWPAFAAFVLAALATWIAFR